LSPSGFLPNFLILLSYPAKRVEESEEAKGEEQAGAGDWQSCSRRDWLERGSKREHSKDDWSEGEAFRLLIAQRGKKIGNEAD
jgi:hypothetical protein